MTPPAQPRGPSASGGDPGRALTEPVLVLERTVWHTAAQHHTTYMLHPEKHHNGECADCQETVDALIAASALCVGEGGEGGGECVLVKGGGSSGGWEGKGGGGGFSVQPLTLPPPRPVRLRFYGSFTKRASVCFL